MSTLSRSPSSALGTAAFLLAATPATAEPPPQKDWEIRLSPYLWLTSIQGNVGSGVTRAVLHYVMHGSLIGASLHF